MFLKQRFPYVILTIVLELKISQQFSGWKDLYAYKTAAQGHYQDGCQVNWPGLIIDGNGDIEVTMS